MQVEVAYALPDEQVIFTVELPEGCTAKQAILKSGILERFPEIDCTVQKIGIFSQRCRLDKVLQEGDRVEIYRSLTIDPKQARLLRAK